ncbi:MAG TPA: hypothetical protein PKE03_07115 [Bacteroidales bacterium]|nr:hypothetical protein [Bacteroidales bacterium]
MTKESRLMSGIILLTVPTIIFGGNFLLGLMSGNYPEMELTSFQQAMFRAGHGHAGVLVILALIAQFLVDQSDLSQQWRWIVRAGFPFAAILVSGGFFAAAAGNGLTAPNNFVAVLYLGMAVLALSLVTLGIGLVRGKKV